MSVFLTATEIFGIVLQLIFTGRLLGKRHHPRLALFAIAGAFAALLPAPQLVLAAIVLLILFIYGALGLHSDILSSAVYSALLLEIMRISYGLTSSLTMLAAAFFYHKNPAFVSEFLMIFGELFSLLLFCICSEIISKMTGLSENNIKKNPSAVIILIPNLLIFIIAEYIFKTFYSVADTEFPIGKSLSLLLVQALGIISIFCTLFAYRKLWELFFIGRRLAASEQQSHFQRQYAAAARSHYEATKSLRHDMNNHLSVLRGLLEKGEYSRAEGYLGELGELSADTSFGYRTGCPVLDILLENKASEKGVQIDCEIDIPPGAAVSDSDWCAVFANALDNAVAACMKLPCGEEKRITVSGKSQGDFFLICIQNPFDGGGFKRGTGLENIARAAKKYGGGIEIFTENNLFTLKILLNISRE